MTSITTGKCIHGASGRVKKLLEQFFYWWGCTVASNPYKVILTVILLAGLSTLSLLSFSSESSSWKLWLPSDSRHWNVENWKEKHFRENLRATITFFTHEENVLTSEALLLLLDLHEKVRSVEFEGLGFDHACMKIPITNIGLKNSETSRKKRYALLNDTKTGDDFEYNYDYINFYGETMGAIEHDEEEKSNDTIDNLPREIYCDIVETLQDKCGEFSLLELWEYKEEVIAKLSNQDIIDAIHLTHESPVFGYETNFTNYLGQVTFNSSGHVVGAKSVRSLWLEEFDPDEIPPTNQILGFDLDAADPFTVNYEAEVIKVLKEWAANRTEESHGYTLYLNAGRSYTDEASGPIELDVRRTIYGYLLMFTYTMLSLGKLNKVEHKFYLAAVGIFSCLYGSVIGIGFSTALGFTYSVLSGLIPFICLGIGIDDMFVIIKCFNNIPEDERKSNGLVENIGITLKHAGVSITITSLTDIFAFGIGALTSFPALQSFCLSAAIGILAVFLFQSSWVVAWMVVDQRRIEQKRDGFIPTIVHKDWAPPEWTSRDFGTFVTSKVAKLFDFCLFRFLIILLSITMVAGGIWGVYNVKIIFDIRTLLPDDSYLLKWIEQSEVDSSTDGMVFGVDFFTQDLPYNLATFEKLEAVVNELNNLTFKHREWVLPGNDLPKFISTRWESATGFWWLDFKKFVSKHKEIEDWRDMFSKGVFPKYLSDFLHHKDGSSYNYHFRFDGNISCNMEAPPISAVKLGALKLRDLISPTQHIRAHIAFTNITDRANLTHKTLSSSVIFAPWEIEEILAEEMLPNLSLALVCVMSVVLVTLADIYVCLLILCCVLFTMIDVVGAMYYCGIIIDPFSLASIIIGIGLSVDYSVHIAHAFIVSEGTRGERIKKAFITISPAVMQGGITTFLSLVFLSDSVTYSFFTFFKIMSMIVLFGLFHGLLFLPNMLSLPCGSVNHSEPDDFKKNVPLSNITVSGMDNPGFKPTE